MRNLNLKQKRLLINYLQVNSCVFSHNQLPYMLVKDLEYLNDHETIYQNIDRFIADYNSASLYGSKYAFDWKGWK